ncbi:MAG TPA: 1-acyl-sn-glycerol-3-phosphate acyltransferase, partial [Gemmatimonadaceae bacterium]
DPAQVAREASRDLREIAATHSPFVIDLVAHGIRLLYTRGYAEALHYDRAQLAEIKALAQQHPVVFLPSHKSNLDHLVLQYALHENGHPPNHTAGGINMNFFPVGPLVRRSGVFFIRRSFKDDVVYKFVLQHYIDYLVEKRFTLEWYVEGGRSRTGKLLPPRFGMLAYVVDAYRRGKAEDVMLVPVSIAYDQIQDVGDYAAEQGGAPKQRESFTWFVRLVQRLRRRSGEIHIRFGEPLSLARALGPPDHEAEASPEEPAVGVQKVAFEVAHRINRATPITPVSLVTLALLGMGDRAATVPEIVRGLENLVAYVTRRKLPTTEELHLGRPEEVERVLQALIENDVVSCFDEGPEP